MAMTKRPLGRTGLEISPIIFGGNVFGWTVDKARSFELLDACLAEGIDTIDTADCYSSWAPGNQGGESETIIGDWMASRGCRSRVVIATKVGWDMPPDGKGLRAPYIMRSAEASLRRLRTDHIDLYQSHRPDPDTPVEETLEAYSRLIAQGKVRAIGASNHDTLQIAAALTAAAAAGLPRYATLQPRYNLIDRDTFEGPLQQLCLDESIAAIPFYSLASGFLTGKYRSAADKGKSARGAGMDRYMTPHGFAVLAALDQVAEKHGAQISEVALAWLMDRPAIAAPIASATSAAQLSSLAKAAGLALDTEDRASLDVPLRDQL